METARFKVIAVIAAVVTAALAFYYLNRVEESRPIQTTVLEAVTTIPQGTEITSDMVQQVQVYESDVVPSVIVDPDEAVGLYATTTIYGGEQVSSQKVTDQMSSASVASFSYKIPKGMRTVTIAIDPTTSVANMIQVGDHVDILATYKKTVDNSSKSTKAVTKTSDTPENSDTEDGSEEKDSTAQSNADVGETVTRYIADDIEVAALDQTIVRGSGDSSDSSSDATTYTTVTLFVTPDLAKALVWENQNGSLVFTLRSPDETENPDHEEFDAKAMEEF